MAYVNAKTSTDQLVASAPYPRQMQVFGFISALAVASGGELSFSKHISDLYVSL